MALVTAALLATNEEEEQLSISLGVRVLTVRVDAQYVYTQKHKENFSRKAAIVHVCFY